MKVIQTLVVLVSILVMPIVVNAASCDSIWDKDNLPQGRTINQMWDELRPHIVIGDGEWYSSEAVGQHMVKHFETNCKERFDFLPNANKTALGFLGYVLRNEGELFNGVSEPDKLPAELVEGAILDGNGFGSFLPTSKMVIGAKGEVISLASVHAELQVLKADLGRLSEKPVSEEEVAGKIERLTEIGKLTQNNPSEGMVGEVEGVADTIRGGFIAYQKNGELHPDLLAAINKQVDGQLNALKAADQRHEAQLAAQEGRIDEVVSEVSTWHTMFYILCVAGILLGLAMFLKGRSDEKVRLLAQAHETLLNGGPKETGLVKELEDHKDQMVEVIKRLGKTERQVQEKQPGENPELNEQIVAIISKVDQLDEDLKKKIDGVAKRQNERSLKIEKKLDHPDSGLAATHAMASEGQAMSREAMRAQVHLVEFDKTDDEINALVDDSKIGEEYAVPCWCTYRDERYVAKIWYFGEGKIQADIIRHITSDKNKVGAAKPENLKVVFLSAIVSGRLPPAEKPTKVA